MKVNFVWLQVVIPRVKNLIINVLYKFVYTLFQLMLIPPNRRVFGSQSVVDSLKDTIRNFISPPGLSPK